MQTPTTPYNRRRGLRCVYRSVSVAALLLLALTVLPWGGTIAHAHASLLSSDPVNGTNVLEAPETLRLTFSEDVTLLETTRLTGPGGETAYSVTVEGGLVTLLPETPLTDGRWSIVWQVVSADGHLVGGVIAFTVGSGSAPLEELSTTAEGTAYVTGTSGDSHTGTGASGVLDRILELLGWLALIAALGALIAGRTSLGVGYGAAGVFVPMLRIVDAFDRWGSSAWLIGETRAVLAAALAGVLLLVAAFQSGRTRTTLLVLAVLTWSAQTFLSGHPNVVDPKPLYAALSALHLAGALTWSAAVTAVFLNPKRGRHASRVASLGITLLLPGAVLLVSAFIPAAFANGAGRWEGILAAKAALVLGALLLGWRNHRDIWRGDFETQTPPNLRRRTGIEIALIALIAVLSASLTTSVPARVLYAGTNEANSSSSVDASSTNNTGTAAGIPEKVVVGETGTADENLDGRDERTQTNATLLFENGETGDLLLEIATDGSAIIHLVLRDPDGNPFTGEQVEYELENPELAIAGIAGELPVNGGMHMGETVLPGQGTWRMSVHVTYDTFTTISATTEIETAETGQ
jgi:methionine-rich copper-binding protein CopC